LSLLALALIFLIPAAICYSQRNCGVLCLAYLLEQTNRRLSRDEIETLSATYGEKISMEEIAAIAKSRGYKARGFRITATNLPKIRFPVIAHVDGNHFVVVENSTKTRVQIYDPLARLSNVFFPEDFAKRWDGTILVVSNKEIRSPYAEGNGYVRVAFIIMGGSILYAAIIIAKVRRGSRKKAL
jgi:ATP-binding cassette subfamily B protein